MSNRPLAAWLLAAVAPAARRKRRSRPTWRRSSYLLIDLTTNQTLAEHDADAPADPASLTKLMTAYLVFGAMKDNKLTLEQTLPVSKRAWNERKGGASVMFIDTTMKPKVDELLQGHDRAVGQRRHRRAGRRRRPARSRPSSR